MLYPHFIEDFPPATWGFLGRQEPLLEEYTTARAIYGLSGTDRHVALVVTGTLVKCMGYSNG